MELLTSKIIRFFALSLTGICIICFGTPTALAAAGPTETKNIPLGNVGFISLAQHLHPTDIPDVYQLMMSVDMVADHPVLTDIVLVMNTGQTITRSVHLLKYATDPIGTARFGYVLDSFGNPTTTERRSGSLGNYSVWDAICYSTEQMIRSLFDPAMNQNHEYTRVALVSAQGNGAVHAAQNDSGLVGYQDMNFLLGKLGDIESVPSGGAEVPFTKQIQNAYQLLAPMSENLYYNFTSVSPAVAVNDLSAPLPNGQSISGSLTNGMWTPLLPEYSAAEKYIVAVHGIGANNGDGLGNYPLSGPYPATDPTTLFNGGNSLTVPGAVAMDIDGPGVLDPPNNWFPIPYNIYRFNVIQISDRLKNENNNKVYHSFTLWLDPSPAATSHSAFIAGWLDNNDTISSFPIDGTGPVPGSGYQIQANRTKALRLTPAGSIEYWEGVQYWSDKAEWHNVQDFPDIATEIQILIQQIAPVEPDPTVHAELEDRFAIVQYPGKSLYEVIGAESDAVKLKGNKIKWDLQKFIPGETAMLTFYVKVDKAGMQDDLSYPLMKHAYIHYTRRGIAILGESRSDIMKSIKYFPLVFLDGKSAFSSSKYWGGTAGSRSR